MSICPKCSGDMEDYHVTAMYVRHYFSEWRTTEKLIYCGRMTLCSYCGRDDLYKLFPNSTRIDGKKWRFFNVQSSQTPKKQLEGDPAPDYRDLTAHGNEGHCSHGVTWKHHERKNRYGRKRR